MRSTRLFASSVLGLATFFGAVGAWAADPPAQPKPKATDAKAKASEPATPAASFTGAESRSDKSKANGSPPPAKAKAAEADSSQAKPSTAPSATKAPAGKGGGAAAQAEFEKVFGEWRRLLSQLRALQAKRQTGDEESQAATMAEFKKLIIEGRKMLPAVGAAAEKAFLADPQHNRDAADFLVGRVYDNVQDDHFDEALRISKVLNDHGKGDNKLYRMAGEAAYALNDFDQSSYYFKKIADDPEATRVALSRLKRIQQATEDWKTEQAIREKEAKADDLPRVKLTTSKGDIVVELYENDAPNTVANFINLVEKGYYTGIKFHRVIPHFMAQGGDPKGDGSGGPGYTIPDEVNKPDYRRHFRGTLSMAKTEAPDSGGSQFFLTFVPTENLDGKHTAFGRVIEGMDVADNLQRTEGIDAETAPTPDIIKKAEVIRKRDHEYKAKTTPDKK